MIRFNRVRDEVALSLVENDGNSVADHAPLTSGNGAGTGQVSIQVEVVGNQAASGGTNEPSALPAGPIMPRNAVNGQGTSGLSSFIIIRQAIDERFGKISTTVLRSIVLLVLLAFGFALVRLYIKKVSNVLFTKGELLLLLVSVLTYLIWAFIKLEEKFWRRPMILLRLYIVFHLILIPGLVCASVLYYKLTLADFGAAL